MDLDAPYDPVVGLPSSSTLSPLQTDGPGVHLTDLGPSFNTRSSSSKRSSSYIDSKWTTTPSSTFSPLNGESLSKPLPPIAPNPLPVSSSAGQPSSAGQKAKGKRGRKKGSQSVDSKRERNRIAASKCRAKNQRWQQSLEEEARTLQSQNTELTQTLKSMKEEQLYWKERLVKQSWDCAGGGEAKCEWGKRMLDGLENEVLGGGGPSRRPSGTYLNSGTLMGRFNGQGNEGLSTNVPGAEECPSGLELFDNNGIVDAGGDVDLDGFSVGSYLADI